MASYLKSLCPVPSFPEYTGPYKVGTVDVEIPVAELDAPSPPPRDAVDTVLFRVFYPCEVEAKTSKHIGWFSSPQRAHVSAFTRFMGAGSILADFISFFPRQLYHISIPARKNAPLLQPASERWPVMVFSHGLAGSRNAYSYVAGSIASHGVIVIAPEHRDGSAPISFVRSVPEATEKGEKEEKSEKSNVTKGRSTVDYIKIPHIINPENEAARTLQLKIRLYELGCIHDALMKIDQGVAVTNLNTSSTTFLPQFTGKMMVHEPGSISFAGHSFGAATMVQFVKSTFYSSETSAAPASYEPIFTPSSRSAISKQITPCTPLILLDLWCFSLRAAPSRWLWNKPLPCYAAGGPGGCAVLAIESQAFYKWRLHLKATKRLLSPNPASVTNTVEDDGRPSPHFYYATASAHLSQSDFGILFPWITRKIFAIEEPERIMKLNVRAILQLLRERNIPVAPTSAADMEIGSETNVVMKDDPEIFSTNGDVKGWNFLNCDVTDLSDVDLEDDSKVDENAHPTAAVVSGEVMNGIQGTEKMAEVAGSVLNQKVEVTA